MAGEWISCGDYLPEHGEVVIAFDPKLWDEKWLGAGASVGQWWGDCWTVEGAEANVTHWMPFPQPPKGGNHGR